MPAVKKGIQAQALLRTFNRTICLGAKKENKTLCFIDKKNRKIRRLLLSSALIVDASTPFH
jgi:hypothetical protein